MLEKLERKVRKYFKRSIVCHSSPNSTIGNKASFKKCRFILIQMKTPRYMCPFRGF